MPITEYIYCVARTPTTLDSFSAIAEPRRRQVLSVLAQGGAEWSVNRIVSSLGWPQPHVSKHLAVLRHVGLVTVRRQGRNRMYRLNGEQLKPIHDWAKSFERFWAGQLDRIKGRAERTAREHADRNSHKEQ
jgi:DNA-binding transcriptional ArsR family regulator